MFAPTQRSGSITPFGSAVEPLVNCRIARRSGSSGGRVPRRGADRRAPSAASSSSSTSAALDVSGTAGRGTARGRGRPPRARRRRSRCAARVWSTNSSIDPSRIGSGSATTVPPASHIGLDGGDQRAGGRPEHADVDPGAHAAGLERGGHAPGVVVESGPLDPVGGAGVARRGTDEGDGPGPLGGGLEARDDRGHQQFDSRASGGVTRRSAFRSSRPTCPSR